MTDTSQSENVPPPEPQTNGIMDGLDDDDKNKMRPADIDADMKEMERRKRVEMIMNSRLFREELERIIETQLKDGSGPSGLLQQISDMMGVQGGRLHAGSVFKGANCVVPINDIRGVESMGYAKGEKILRCKLAAVYRLMDLYGWTQGVNNLITARLNQDQEHFLINPFGMLFHEITASSLVKIDMQGAIVEQGTTNFGVNVAGFLLHSAIHAARPDVKCIIHVHTPSVLAVSSLKCGLLPLCQEAIVIGEVSHHPYLGGLFEPEEREKITRNLGPINKVMFLANHGAVCCGETVEEAFYNVYNTVLACETQIKLMPIGVENLVLVSDETRKQVYEAAHRPPVITPKQPDATDLPPSGIKKEKQFRIGSVEFEALMRMLDNAGFRTGYIYRQPLVKGEPPRPRNDVEVPPAVSSLGYLLEEEEMYRTGNWKKYVDGRKTHDRTRWLNSPNVYQRVEILETGTPDPKKITKWVDANADEWVAEGSPTHSSTPVKIESALQFVPKNTNPREFKKLQQQIKDNRRADKITSGPQSHILEGVSWEEAKKLQDANISATGDQVILVGAASKGIIQRGFQHNALVYKTPYAKNPFDTVTDEELEEYKKVVERKQKGESFDDDQSESEPLSSSLQNSRPLDGMDAVKSPLMSPMSATSETEEESKDEPRVLRIETKQVPRPSQAEVVLSDAESDLPDPSVERSMSLRIPAKVADATDVEGQMSRSWSLGRDKTKMKDASDPVCVHIARLGMLPSLQNVSFPGLLPAWHFTNFHPVLSSNTRHPVLISNLITKAHSFDAKAFECVCVHSLSTEDVDCTVSAEQLSKTTMNVCASLNAPHISVVSDLDECSSVNVGQTLVKSITIPECKNIAEYSVFGQHAGMTFQAGAANNIDSVHTKEVSFNACSFEFLDHHIIVEHSSAAHFETTYAKCMENSTYEESVVNTRDIMNQGSDALSSTDAGFLDKMDKTEIEETVHPVPDRFDLHVLNYSSHEVSVIACSGTMGCDLDEMAETELKEKSIVTCNFDSHDSTFSGRESSLAQNGGRTNPATLDMKNKGVEILSEERNLIGITVNHNIHNVSAEDSSFSFHHDTSLTQDKVVFQDSHISDLERRKTRKSDKALHTPDFKACSLDMYDKESSIIEDGVTRHHIPAYIVAQKVGFTDVERRMTGGEDTACHSPSLNVQNVTFSDQEGSIVGDVGTSHHATAYFEDEEIGPSDQEESVIEDVGTSHHTTAYFEAEEIGPSDQEESIIGDVCTSHHTTAYFEAEEIGPSDEAGVVTGGGDTVYQISSLKVQDNDLSDKEGSVNGEGDTYHTAAYLEAQKIDFCDEERNKKADGNTAHYSSDFFEAQGICFTNQEGCQYGDGVIACNIILDGEKTEVTVPGKLSHPKETVENDGTRFSENHSDRLLLPGFSYALYEEDDDNVFHHVGNEPKELYDSGIRTCTVCTKNDSIQQDKVVIQEPGAHSSDEHITIGKLGENTVSECAAGMNESSSAESVNEYADEYYSDSVEYFLVDSNFSEFTEFCKDKSSEFYSKDVGLYNHVEFYSKDKNASMPEMFYSKDENKTHFVKFSSSSNATTKCKESCASSTHTQQCTECYMTNVHDSPEYHEKSYKSQKQKKMYSKKCKHNYTENKHAPCNAMERKNSDEFLFSNSRNVNVDCFHETTESSATSNVFPENNFNVFSKSESNACDNTHVSQIDISYESPAECENELHNHARGRCVSSESYSSHETNKFRGNNQYKNSISNNDNLASAYHAKGSNKDTYSEKYMTLVLSRSKESAYNFKVANCEKYTKTPASCNDVGGVYVKPRGLTFSYNEGNGIKETCEAMGEENVHTEYKIGLSGNSFENNSRHNRIDVFKLKIVNFEESLKLDPLILHNLFLARMKLVMDEEIMLKLMLQNSDFERLNLYIRLKCFEGTEDGYSSDSEHTEDKIVANNVVVTADGKVALNETYCLSEHVQFNALNKSLCNAAHINIEKGVLIWVSYERTKCPCSQKVLSTTIVHCRHLAVCDHNNSEEMDMASEYSSEAQQHVWFHLHVSCLQCEVERCMLDDGNGCVDSSINGDYLVCDCKNFSESVASSGSDNIMLMDLNDNYVKRISFPVVENNPRQDVENLVTVNVTNPHGGICANSSDNLKQIMGLERCALGHVVEKAIVEIGNNCGVCSHHSPVRNKEASSEEDKESFVWENPHAFNWKGDHYADDFSERNCKSFEDLTFNSSDSVMELGDWSNGEDNEESVYVMAGNDSAYSPIAESKGYHKFSADYGKDDLQGCYENDKSPRMIKLKGARCIQATTDNQSLLCDNIFDMSSIHKGTINEQNYLDQERYQFDASSANSSDSTGSCGSGNGVCLADHIMQPFPDFSRYLYLTVDDNTQDAESTETPDFSLQSSGVQEEILHVEKEECDAETQTENFDSHSDFPVTFPTVYCANKPLFCCVVDPEFAEHGTSSNYSFPSSLHAFNRVTQNFQQTSFTLDTITEED